MEPLGDEVVRRFLADLLEGNGHRAIANALNRDCIPCPSAARPEQNRHRHGDGWQSSTVRAILDNPRYTGYAVFGRWTGHETLLDPNDVAAGYVTRSRRAAASSVVRSRKPAYRPRPGSPLLETHPTNVYLREAHVIGPLNEWLDRWFGREQRQTTVEAMLGVDLANPDTVRAKQVKASIADAEKRRHRLQAAIEAGADPDALIDGLNRAKADKDAAKAELRRIPSGRTVDRVQIEAALDYLEDVDRILDQGKPERLQEFYKKLGLELIFDQKEKTVAVKAKSLGRDSKCVGGGT
ncbi:recombinase family protein [Sciscionella sediminilitoris]|uniref:recombinase family protein n=1 Tax=Sciscionella sediminilitoris TaxID=1445613 RepID=UPI0018D10284|nr:recombinase family protein [Sciscionella sp. SE31]